ncbi:MAG: serine protease Do [Myxococcota bacterium]|jgi:serine protease Do
MKRSPRSADTHQVRSAARLTTIRRLSLLAILLPLASLALEAPAHAADPFLRRTATVEVVEKVGPAVVNITTELIDTRRKTFTRSRPGNNEFYRDFLRPKGREPSSEMLGSGVIIDKEGHVLTNAHVIAGSSRIRVTLADGREFPASLVGAAPNNDLAVLLIETDETLPWVPTGVSDDLMVGEPVIAIGNPFGLFSNTVTTGVLSAIDRSVNVEGDYYYGFLQTDASINPGNSGGPLLNAEGTLIGINTAIYKGAQGIGLAIPIDTANRVVDELIEHGEIPPPWIGLEFQNLEPELRTVMQLPDGMSGALVTKVEPGSPAEASGMKRGDLVIGIDGHRVARDRSFFEALRTSLVGQTIQLDIWRNEEVQPISLVGVDLPDHIVLGLAEQFLGVQLAPEIGLGYRIEALNVAYPAIYYGIEKGDVVLGINGRSLRYNDDLRNAMVDLRRDYAATGARNRVILEIRRGTQQQHFSLPSFEAFTAVQKLKGR